MRTLLIISSMLLIGRDFPVEGIYTSQERNYYKLELKSDSTFLLENQHFDWDITRFSKGNWSLLGDTIVCNETKKWHVTSIEIDTSRDELTSIKLTQDSEGNLITSDFSLDMNLRKKSIKRILTKLIRK